jgi:uncharacterized protein YegP (UPF0339 family)
MPRYQAFRSADGFVRWRLLAGNNRVVGLAAHVFGDLPDAISDIVVMREVAVRVIEGTRRPATSRDESGLWRWRLIDERAGRCVALAGQGFARRIDAQLAAVRFVNAAVRAKVDPGLAVFQAGRRGRTVA